MHSTLMYIYVKIKITITNISRAVTINVAKITCVHMNNTCMDMCVIFEVPILNISGVLGKNVVKEHIWLQNNEDSWCCPNSLCALAHMHMLTEFYYAAWKGIMLHEQFYITLRNSSIIMVKREFHYGNNGIPLQWCNSITEIMEFQKLQNFAIPEIKVFHISRNARILEIQNMEL